MLNLNINHSILDETIASYHSMMMRIRRIIIRVIHREDVSKRSNNGIVVLRHDVDFLTNQTKDRIIR